MLCLPWVLFNMVPRNSCTSDPAGVCRITNRLFSLPALYSHTVLALFFGGGVPPSREGFSPFSPLLGSRRSALLGPSLSLRNAQCYATEPALQPRPTLCAVGARGAGCRYCVGMYAPANNDLPALLLRGTIVNKTYVIHKKTTRYVFSHFLRTIFGPINYDPP